jgi:hypothetical protein
MRLFANRSRSSTIGTRAVKSVRTAFHTAALGAIFFLLAVAADRAPDPMAPPVVTAPSAATIVSLGSGDREQSALPRVVEATAHVAP